MSYMKQTFTFSIPSMFMLMANVESLPMPAIDNGLLYTQYKVQEDYIPIVGYHKIVDDLTNITDLKTATTTEIFREQVAYFTNVAKCNWITMADVAYYIKHEQKLPTNACVITFDDGIQDQIDNCLCALNEHKIPSSFYVLPEYIRPNLKSDLRNGYYMSMEGIELLKESGHDIEPHTMLHEHLSTLPYEEQRQTIHDSKKWLEANGFGTSTSFAYPYGDYNNDTLKLMDEFFKQGEFVLARDTRQDHYWKNPRAVANGFDTAYLKHFYYIHPEAMTGKQLWDDYMQYNYWWQFEDAFQITSGEESPESVHEFSKNVPTETSYGALELRRANDTIKTQFKTKYLGSFSLEMIISTNSKVELMVDGFTYVGIKGKDVYQTPNGHTPYFNFYINIPELKPGLHILSVKNAGTRSLYLDKFRLFSNVNQDFIVIKDYESCDPADEACPCI